MKNGYSNKTRLSAGFSLIEVSVATLLVGVLLAGTLAAFGHVREGQFNMTMSERGHLLALDLMNEILALPYSEPGVTNVATGPESGEVATNRTTFDDIDDYHGLSEINPTSRGGVAIAGASRFRRRVTVIFVQANSPFTLSVTNQGLRMVIVAIDLDGQQVALLYGIKSQTDDQNP